MYDSLHVTGRVPLGDCARNWEWMPRVHWLRNPIEADGYAVINAYYLKPLYLHPVFSRLVLSALQGLRPCQAFDNLVAAGMQVNDVADLARAALDARIVAPRSDLRDLANTTLDELRNDRGLKELYLFVTVSCNLRCPHCLSRPTTATLAPGMTPEIALKSVDLFTDILNPAHRNSVVLYGGEPMLAWDLVRRVLDRVSRHPKFGRRSGQLRCRIVSNGTLMTREKARELADHDTEVVLSFDGPDPLNNRLRPSRSSKCALGTQRQVLDVVREAGCDVALSVTLSDYSVAALDSITEWLISLRLPVMISSVKRTGLTPQSPGFAQRVSSAVVMLYEALLSAGIVERRLGDIRDSLCRHRPVLQDCYAQGGHQIVVSTDGAVGVCQAFASDRLFFSGNILDIDSPQRLLDLPAVRWWGERLAVNMEPCRNCSAVGVCGGGCPASAYRTHGSFWDVDDVHCSQTRKVFSWLLWSVCRTPELQARLRLPDFPLFSSSLPRADP